MTTRDLLSFREIDQLMQSFPGLFALRDCEQRWQLANDEYLKKLRLDGANYKGKTAEELAQMHPDCRNQLQFCASKDIDTIRKGTPTRDFEHVETNLGRRYFDITRIPLFDRGGQVSLVATIGQEVTQLHNIVMHSPIAMFVVRRDGTMLLANQSFRKIFGISPSEEIENILELQLISNDYFDIIRKLDMRGRISGEEMRLKSADTCLSVVISAEFIDYGESEAIICWVNDVSQQIQKAESAEQSAKAAMSEAEMAKQEATYRADILAAFSHEIRTPLAWIMGFSEKLMTATDDETRMEAAKVIAIGANAINELVDNVMHFSKIDSGQFFETAEVFNLTDLADDLKIAAERQISFQGRDIETMITVDRRLSANISGKKVAINVIFLNIIYNAIKYTPKGLIEIGMRLIRTDGDAMVIGAYVDDTGPGIPASERAMIFDRFKRGTASQSTRGVGLGLSIVKDILEQQLGGSIVCCDKAGPGARFEFQFLVEKAPLQDSIIARCFGAQTESSPSRRILVIDDEPFNIDIVRSRLIEHGHLVKTASSAHDGIQMLKAEHFDIVLMDLRMDELDGYAATRIIRALPTPRSKIPVLAFTADLGREIAPGLFNGVVPKPINTRQMLETIHAAITHTAQPILHPEPQERRGLDKEMLRDAIRLKAPDERSRLLNQLTVHINALNVAMKSGIHANIINAEHRLRGLALNVGFNEVAHAGIAARNMDNVISEEGRRRVLTDIEAAHAECLREAATELSTPPSTGRES